jgi:hypothetical protein
MQTDCSTTLFDFAPEDRKVVAGFDGGTMTSNAGALLLGSVDKAVRLVERAASCFVDRRDPTLIEHSVATLVGQRILAWRWVMRTLSITTRCDTIRWFAVLAGKLKARRSDCAPVAGKSTLNRLERSKETPSLRARPRHRCRCDRSARVKQRDILVRLVDAAASEAPLAAPREMRMRNGVLRVEVERFLQ